jgi:hypothetical protein
VGPAAFHFVPDLPYILVGLGGRAKDSLDAGAAGLGNFHKDASIFVRDHFFTRFRMNHE